MPLESCMILLDRSQYMRNGDYIPTRLEAQRDAANLLITAKTNSHPESTVGVSAGTELLVSPTEDVGKILAAVHGVKLVPADPSSTTTTTTTTAAAAATEKQSSTEQDADVIASVSVASLALKHRRNKNGAQRIVIFIGTPVHADAKTLQKTGRNLKKNNVHIDVILLGEIEQNEPLLQELVDAANGTSANNNNNNNDANERTCHLVAVPPGVLPSDVLASSPILGAAGAMMGMMMGASNVEDAFGGTGAMDFIGGVDPNMDPELAMALRVSMEEERARQERAAAAAAAAAPTTTTTETTQSAPSPMMDEEEALLQQALAMSMNENEPQTGTDDDEKQDEAQDMDMDEDAAMQMALQMSMQQQESEQDTSNQQIQDPEFVQQILQGMPGVDPNDPEIQEMLRKAAEEKKKQDDQGQDKK